MLHAYYEDIRNNSKDKDEDEEDVEYLYNQEKSE